MVCRAIRRNVCSALPAVRRDVYTFTPGLLIRGITADEVLQTRIEFSASIPSPMPLYPGRRHLEYLPMTIALGVTVS